MLNSYWNGLTNGKRRKIIMSEIVTKLNGQSFEFQMWEEVRKDCGYPEEDNNNGFIYGCHPIDEDGQILDCNWFKSEEERRLFYHT